MSDRESRKGLLGRALVDVMPVSLGPADAVRFREVLRRNLVYPRTGLFLALALGFGLAPFYGEALFRPRAEVVPLLTLVQWAMVTPLTVLAALATLRAWPQALTQGLQSAAVLAALLAVIGFRALALTGAMDYPATMVGVVMIAVAFFGGFAWRRMTLAALGSAALAICVEFALSPGSATPALQAYALSLMALVAALGSCAQEFLARFTWWEGRQLREARAALAESDARFQAFLNHNPGLCWMKDGDGRYVFMSRSYQAFLGVEGAAWQGRTDLDFFPQDFAERCRRAERRVLDTGRAQEAEGPAPDASGTERHWLLVRFPFTDAAGRRFVGGAAINITERKRSEQAVRLQSLTDELCGHYNRRGFTLMAGQALARARNQRQPCALLYVDLDDLKGINQRHGHDGGDRAIIALAEALRLATRNTDVVARIGGDEFLVLAVDCRNVESLKRRILEQLNASGALAFDVTASIGVTEVDPAEDATIESLVAAADARMFEAKRQQAR